ncbi:MULTISPECIES: iron chelate uptake ABC transporter family permease subunit [Roseobacteraceae]|uniref:Fe(3+) dicitrate transport system permease protein FecD n=1 Tax=Pseudosulfitobacter pseudonitzschiae TaxID=1402135 RepID=A0A221K857_9RHOB|nr:MULTISPECIES: iron chelate uptake ABC transporter family permease subunit [Roseobacteraceae]ASM75192.1 Fe(3+) dicitrate transport system permease protein FecD [Pseudosulfitobacter pseudonitzschiae]
MPHKRICVLALLLGVCVAGYMLLGSRGNWAFVLSFRGNKLAALLLVAMSVSTATVLFQTVTQNHILTPSVMGFDALYLLILSVSVFTLGAQEFVRLPETGQFLLNTALMMGVALILFGTLLGRARSDMFRMILTGIVFAGLFRSITGFIQRMIDPNDYVVVQFSSFARFSRIDFPLLAIAATLTCAALLATWRMRHGLDVLALGPDTAINLGVDPRRGIFQVLVIVSVLVSVSTALVGPLAFLGLLVVSVARQITPTETHGLLLPSAALVCAITLVGGQLVLEHLLNLSTPLIVVVDVIGGLVFLGLLLRRKRR